MKKRGLDKFQRIARRVIQKDLYNVTVMATDELAHKLNIDYDTAKVLQGLANTYLNKLR